MDENFIFWLPITEIDQLTFEGQTVKVDKLEEGHIIHSGRLMCGESMERTLNLFKTKKFKKVKTRPEHARICQECQRRYKANLDSAWDKWIAGKPIAPVAKLPPLAKF